MEELFDYKASDAKVLEYYKVLSRWGVNDENLPAIIDEILRKNYKFPALAAFWTAKNETDPWK